MEIYWEYVKYLFFGHLQPIRVSEGPFGDASVLGKARFGEGICMHLLGLRMYPLDPSGNLT